jgi:hypothetical protein
LSLSALLACLASVGLHSQEGSGQMDEIRERQSRRFQFLKLLHDKANAFYDTEAKRTNTTFRIPIADLGSQLGFPPVETEQIVRYLCEEGLIGRVSGTVYILHAGIKEVEDALTKPDRPTEHFAAGVINYLIQADQIINSPFQQGTYDSTQTVSFSLETRQETEKFIQLLKGQLPELFLNTQDRTEAEAEIATIMAQLASPRPKSSIIKTSISTIKNILENIPANVAANIIVANLPGLIENASKLLQSFY